VGALLLATTTYPALVYAVQPFALGPIASGYLGLLLLSATCIAYGLFVSSLTDSQVLAGFLTVMPLFLLWLLSWNEAAVGADTVTMLRALSLFDHFQSFSVGVIEARDAFYFVFLTGVFWWATLRVLEARQWRGRR
jgi:ABC-2 type transport system permease protein